jgi:hypothetical protein
MRQPEIMKIGTFVDGISPGFLGRAGVLRLRRTMRFAHRPAPLRMTLHEFCDAMAVSVFGRSCAGQICEKSHGMKSIAGRGIWRVATSNGGAELSCFAGR